MITDDSNYNHCTCDRSRQMKSSSISVFLMIEGFRDPKMLVPLIGILLLTSSGTRILAGSVSDVSDVTPSPTPSVSN